MFTDNLKLYNRICNQVDYAKSQSDLNHLTGFDVNSLCTNTTKCLQNISLSRWRDSYTISKASLVKVSSIHYITYTQLFIKSYIILRIYYTLKLLPKKIWTFYDLYNYLIVLVIYIIFYKLID